MSEYRLLAKSLDRGEKEPTESQLLSGHLRDVHASAQALVGATGADQLRALGLEADDWLPRFRLLIPLAAALHDLGKANDHFQAMLQPGRFPSRGKMRQGLRHEWASFLLCADPELGLHNWLRAAVEDDFDWQIVLWAVSGHHPAYGRPSPPRLHVEGTGHKMSLLTGHEDFGDILNWLATTFGLGDPPKLSHQSLPLVSRGNAFAKTFRLYRDSSVMWESRTEEQQALCAAAKNCLIGADIAGSALPRQIEGSADRQNWIAAGFQRLPASEQLTALVADRLDVSPEEIDAELRQFQKTVRDGSPRGILVKAGCGTGKTLAAYLWGRDAGGGRRLYFCYPTTGTATQGFHDHFVIDEETADEASQGTVRHEARLFHSRQDIDFEILGIRGEREPGVDDLDVETEQAMRVEALDAWSTPIVNCTADFALGLIQNNRRGLYSWPALAGAAFICDEIHAYDDRLFGALLRFITALRDAPILLMTASLPARRRRLLEQCFARLNHEFIEVPGPEDLETLPRYHREETNGEDALLTDVSEALDGNGKVLWVCNTVQRAMDAYERALIAGLDVTLYHSRFRYEDRVARHRETVEKFRGDDPALVIATQVAEMSLDISATLLVSDLCPVPALIQRLGRLNRRAKPPDDGERLPPTMPFLVVEPTLADGSPFHLPYTPEDLELAQRWLAHLKENRPRELSQRHLADAWEAIEDDTDWRPAFVPSAWLDGGPTTDVLELREGSPGITVIREEDAETVRRREVPAGRVTIPMPPPPKWIRDQLFTPEGREARIQGAFVVNETMLDYTPKRGGQWRRNDQ